MTRINCIPVEELTDKHLIAEYRELPRVFGLARFPKGKEKFPEEYTLGPGHVKFFFNKLDWCYYRQQELIAEMKRRKFRPKHTALGLIKKAPANRLLWGWWCPTEEAMKLNRQRIQERLNERTAK